MAEQFYKYNTSYNGLAPETVYNGQTNQPYSNPQDFFNAGGAQNFSNVQVRTVPVSLNPSVTTNTNSLSVPPVTTPDINSLLQQNQDFQKQVLGLMTPSTQEAAAGQQKNDAYNTLQNFDVSLEGGLQNIMQKPIALEFQQGQEAALTRDAAFTRSSLARAYDASINNLTSIQQNRQQLLQAAQQQEQFGQQNIATKLQMDQVNRTEQAAALKMAMDNNIQSPYFNVGGTFYETSSGKPFTSEQDFQKRTGMTVADALGKNLVQTVNGQAQQEKTIVQDMAVKYPDAGISLQDTLVSAQAKVFGSRLYQQATRLAGGTNSGTPGTNSSSIDSWISLITSGQATIANVPVTGGTRNAVIAALGDNKIITPQQAQKVKDSEAVFSSADSLLTTIEDMSKKVIGATSAPGAFFQNVTQSFGALTKTNADAAVYKDTVAAFTSLLTRAAGEKGVLTDTDVKRISNALPKFSDTAQIAQQKLDTLRTVYNSIKQGAVNTYTPKASSSNDNDPLGLFK